MHIATPAQSKRGLSKKLIIGFATLASAAVIGTVGMANAAHKPTGHEGGSGFTYANINLDVSGDNNIIQIFINYFKN